MTRQYSDSIALTARSLVQSSGVDITQPVTILPLAKQLMAETGCSIDTAKRHVAKAVRLARGELTSPAWGGRRTPAGGRPKMSAKLYSYEVTFVNDDGETVQAVVMARNEFEAVQLAGAFGKVVRSVINQDL